MGPIFELKIVDSLWRHCAHSTSTAVFSIEMGVHVEKILTEDLSAGLVGDELPWYKVLCTLATSSSPWVLVKKKDVTWPSGLIKRGFHLK